MTTGYLLGIRDIIGRVESSNIRCAVEEGHVGSELFLATEHFEYTQIYFSLVYRSHVGGCRSGIGSLGGHVMVDLVKSGDGRL